MECLGVNGTCVAFDHSEISPSSGNLYHSGWCSRLAGEGSECSAQVVWAEFDVDALAPLPDYDAQSISG